MSLSKLRQQPGYPYQANEDKIVIEIDLVDEISFGRKANEDREEGNRQAEPNEYVQKGAQVVLGNSHASHGERGESSGYMSQRECDLYARVNY